MKKKIVALMVCAATAFSSVNANAMGIATWMQRYAATASIVTDNEEIEWIRDIVQWSDFEKTKGEIIIPSSFKQSYERYAQEGKKIIMVLCYGNHLYSGTTNVVMPTKNNTGYFNAWLNYVKTMAKEFDGIVDYFEVWNEPNLEYANSNAYTDASTYGYLFSETKKAVEYEAGTDVKVIGGGVAYGGGWTAGQYIKTFYSNGGSSMDGFSFHVYQYGNAPEKNWLNVIEKLEEVLDSKNYTGPLYLTETGFPTGTSGDAVDEDVQASYLIRMQALWDNYLKQNGRQGEIFWFFANDWGNNLSAVDANHGVLTTSGQKKDSYHSLMTLNSLINDKEFVSLTKSGDTYTALYRNTNSNDEVYILWTVNEKRTANMKVVPDCDEVKVYDYKGELLSTQSGSEGRIDITVDGKPKFVECVNNGTAITKVEVEPNKGLIHVSGKSNHLKTVTIELEKDGVVVDSVSTTVKDGKFKKDLYTNLTGNFTVYAGRTQTNEAYYGSVNVTLEREDILSEPGVINDTITVIFDNGNITISGTTEGFKDNSQITLMVIPENVDKDFAQAENFAYIGETVVQDSSFETRFTMPDNSEGKYKLYVSGNNSNTVSAGIDNGTASGFAKVCDFTLTRDASVSVFASLNNPNIADKKATVIVAQYTADEKGLVDVIVRDVTLKANTIMPQYYNVDVPLHKDAAVVKAFIFDGVDTIKPLTPCIIK